MVGHNDEGSLVNGDVNMIEECEGMDLCEVDLDWIDKACNDKSKGYAPFRQVELLQ